MRRKTKRFLFRSKSFCIVPKREEIPSSWGEFENNKTIKIIQHAIATETVTLMFVKFPLEERGEIEEGKEISKIKFEISNSISFKMKEG